MSPDSAEARLARLDESLKHLLNRLDAISEAYAPTNRTVIENALKIADVQTDIGEIRAEIVKQVERREKDLDDLEKQVLACGHGVGELERRWEKARIAQENRERRAKEAAEERARKERRDRNRWIIGIAVSVLLVVLGAYLGSVFG